jgi:hypothetical protein
VGIQTEPFKIELTDLGNIELLRLMNLLNQYYRTQAPFWVPEIKESN